MASSLQDLLTEDGFQHQKPHKTRRPIKPKPPPAAPDRSLSVPAAAGAGRRSSDLPPDRPNGSSRFSSHMTNSNSLASNPNSSTPVEPCNEAPVAGDTAARAVVSILSGYAGRFIKDGGLRKRLREKCSACLAAGNGVAHSVLTNLELGIESIERLAEEGAVGAAGDSKIRSLHNSIRLLSVVASLSNPRARGVAGGYTCGVPNSHLSACAQLYLSIVYKIERNDLVSARHLLQVFVDSPYLARKNLLPDLWDHLFLPHLLHLKVWHHKEVELIAGWDVEDRDQSMKGLNRAYNDQLDVGTARFAQYYKEWLKDGGEAPPLPSVSLPPRPGCLEPWGKRSASILRSSIDRNLYQAVFGQSLEQEDVDDGLLIDDMKLAVQRELNGNEYRCKPVNPVHSRIGIHPREPDPAQGNSIPKAASTPRKSFSFRLFSCRSNPDKGAIRHVHMPKEEPTTITMETSADVPSINLSQAIALISNSDKLSDCEAAVHVVAKAWLDSRGDSILEKALCSSSVIEGILEVTFTSKDDEILELAISILAELVARNGVSRQVVLNADPQLEIFLRLLRSNNLFLKAAAVLYLLQPKAKQMLSHNWIPLVLHVLDHGDQVQTLFSVQCSPKMAALYFLDQLLMGFDVDRNVENAKQLISLGGLDLLIRRLEMGDGYERKSCASLLAACLQSDGSCRDYLAANIKKTSIVQLLLGNQLKSNGSALSFLSELVCLSRMTKIIKFLNELKTDGCLNTMHVLLVCLQQAPLEQSPVAATILLQLDLLGDPLKYSVYREEGIDALVAALECNHNKKVQEECSRALLLLGGRFSCSGEPISEAWLLRRAGMADGPSSLLRSGEMLSDEYKRLNNSHQVEDEENMEEWLRRLTIILLMSGNKRFLVALSNCIADGISSLARSCLITVAWMSGSLASLHNARHLQSLACSVLAPRLVESLSYDRALEERVLASLSLLNFARYPECLPKLFLLDKDVVILLQDLVVVTWTAKELLFACCR